MKVIMVILMFLTTCILSAQVDYGTPPIDLIPDTLQTFRRAIDVMHFPKENDPVKIKDNYYWKHMTSILCKESEIEIVEYGAYIFYSDQWNLRRKYDLEELDKTFGTERQRMNQAEPYTWAKNYRIDNSLFGGWALWYFIGKTETGETVCGYETIHTTNNILN